MYPVVSLIRFGKMELRRDVISARTPSSFLRRASPQATCSSAAASRSTIFGRSSSGVNLSMSKRTRPSCSSTFSSSTFFSNSAIRRSARFLYFCSVIFSRPLRNRLRTTPGSSGRRPSKAWSSSQSLASSDLGGATSVWLDDEPLAPLEFCVPEEALLFSLGGSPPIIIIAAATPMRMSAATAPPTISLEGTGGDLIDT